MKARLLNVKITLTTTSPKDTGQGPKHLLWSFTMMNDFQEFCRPRAIYLELNKEIKI